MRIIYFIFCALTCFSAPASDANSKMGAIIASGPSHYTTGEILESHFIRKNINVHRIEVRPRNENTLTVTDWKQFKNLKNIPSNAYDKLFFLISGHGNNSVAIRAAWKSWLTLAQYLEEKTKELFIHISTCYSGNVVDEWLAKLDSEKLKVFITSSCSGSTTHADYPRSIYENFFSGHWNFHDGDISILEQRIKNFQNLECDASIFKLVNTESRTCSREGCKKNHIHKGWAIKAIDWRIFPFVLTDIFTTRAAGYDFPSIEYTHTRCDNPLLNSQYQMKPNKEITVVVDAKGRKFFNSETFQGYTLGGHPSNWQIFTTTFDDANPNIPALQYEGSGNVENSWFVLSLDGTDYGHNKPPWKKYDKIINTLEMKKHFSDRKPYYNAKPLYDRFKYLKTITLGKYVNPNTVIIVNEDHADPLLEPWMIVLVVIGSLLVLGMILVVFKYFLCKKEEK